ncbi:MAG: hypothetical protein R2754_01795 [Microthrixaceae bacterium]
MTNNTFKVNRATGALEVLNVEAVVASGVTLSGSGDAQAGGEGLYRHRRSRDFTNLGALATQVVPALMAPTSDEQLHGLLTLLPPPRRRPSS